MQVTEKRFGNRRDGRRVNSLDPFFRIIPYIMKTRSGSQNFFSGSIDVSEAEKYIHYMRMNGHKNFGMLSLFIAAYVRVISKYPGINRFISGQRVYARNNITVSMTVKKEMTLSGAETTIKTEFAPTDTALEVYHKLITQIETARNTNDSTETDAAAALLTFLPGLSLKFAISFISFLDYFGIMPKFLYAASPFHSSLFVTNLASLGVPPVFHHLYDFGNTPVFLAFGAKRKSDDGRRFIDFNMTIDDRICDGYYLASAFRMFKNIFKDPRVLDLPPESVTQDID